MSKKTDHEFREIRRREKRALKAEKKQRRKAEQAKTQDKTAA